MKTISALICVLLFTWSLYSAEDWPCFRANIHLNATVDAELKTPLHLQWEYTPAQKPKPAWPDPVKERYLMNFDVSPKPIIVAGKIYIGSSADDTLRVFDLKTGQPTWHFITGGPIRFAPAYMDGNIYLGSDDGYVYCLDANSGSEQWRFRGGHRNDMLLGNGRMVSTWALRSGVLVDDGCVYFTVGVWPNEGVYVFALDAKTGKQVWCNDTCDVNGGPVAHTPAYAISGLTPHGYMAANEEYLLIPTGRGFPVRFNRKTGEYVKALDADRIPHSGANKMGGGQVMIGENNIFFNANRVLPSKKHKGSLYSEYSIIDGTLKTRKGTDKIPLPSYNEIKVGSILFRAESGQLSAFDQAHKKIWSYKTDGTPDGMAFADGQLVVATSTGKMYCFAGKSAGSIKQITDELTETRTEQTALAKTVLQHLDAAGVSKGYGLLLGGADVRNAEAIAAKTDLKLICVFGDEKLIKQERERLLRQTALYGSRIAIVHVKDLHKLPFKPYFANLVIVEGPGVSHEEAYRVLRPCGGIMYCAPVAGVTPQQMLSAGIVADELQSKSPLCVIRGKLKGAFDWNSKNSADERVKWPLELSWYGGPVLSQMLTKLTKTQTPRVANGRYFFLAKEGIVAADMYNGTQLWTFSVPAMKEKGGAAISALSADDSHVFLKIGSELKIIDAQRGSQVDQYPGELPSYAGEWGPTPRRSKGDSYFSATRTFTTGEKTEINYQKTYGCMRAAQSATMDFFRSGTFSYYDYVSDAGVRNYGGIRPACGSTAGVMPANGVVVVSDPGTHCVCSYNMETSFAMVPAERKKHNDWSIFNDTQIREATKHTEYMLNIGAPGDQRDDKHKLWLSFPRVFGNINSRITMGVPLRFDNEERIDQVRVNPDRVEFKKTDKPWIYASMNRGVSQMTFDLTHSDPRFTIVSHPTAQQPALDGKLDDACWTDIGQLRDLKTKGLVSMRHDKKNLYVSCRRKIYTGTPGPWQTEKPESHGTIWGKKEAFEVYFNMPGKIDFLHFGVSESGELHSGLMSQHIQTPKVTGITVDAKMDDWKDSGLYARFESTKKNDLHEVVRMGWDEKGILIGGQVPKAYVHSRRPTAYVFLLGDLKLEKTVQIRADFIKKELKVLGQNGVESSQRMEGDDFLFECRVPWSALGLKSGKGERIFMYPLGLTEKMTAKNDNIFCSPKDLKSLYKGIVGKGSVRYDVQFEFVDDTFVDNFIIVDSRIKMPTAPVYIISSYEHRSWEGDWTGKVTKANAYVDYEISVPFKTFEDAGLNKDRLTAGFGGLVNVLKPEYKEQWIQSDWGFWNAVNASTYRVIYKDAKAEKEQYTVRMHFAELENLMPGERVFDIKLQGKVVEKSLDVLKAAGGQYTALIKEYKGVSTEGTIQIEFVPHGEAAKGKGHQPILNGLEIIRQK